MTMQKGFKQFLIKTGVFIAFFIIFSFIVGTKIFTNNFIEVWKIGIYARIGYILLFSIAGFILLYRKRLTEMDIFKHKPRDSLMLALSVLTLVGFLCY